VSWQIESNLRAQATCKYLAIAQDILLWKKHATESPSISIASISKQERILSLKPCQAKNSLISLDKWQEWRKKKPFLDNTNRTATQNLS